MSTPQKGSAAAEPVVAAATYVSHASTLETIRRYLSKTRSQELLIRSGTLIMIYLLAFCIRLVRTLSSPACGPDQVRCWAN